MGGQTRTDILPYKFFIHVFGFFMSVTCIYSLMNTQGSPLTQNFLLLSIVLNIYFPYLGVKVKGHGGGCSVGEPGRVERMARRLTHNHSPYQYPHPVPQKLVIHKRR